MPSWELFDEQPREYREAVLDKPYQGGPKTVYQWMVDLDDIHGDLGTAQIESDAKLQQPVGKTGSGTTPPSTVSSATIRPRPIRRSVRRRRILLSRSI